MIKSRRVNIRRPFLKTPCATTNGWTAVLWISGKNVGHVTASVDKIKTQIQNFPTDGWTSVDYFLKTPCVPTNGWTAVIWIPRKNLVLVAVSVDKIETEIHKNYQPTGERASSGDNWTSDKSTGEDPSESRNWKMITWGKSYCKWTTSLFTYAPAKIMTKNQ